MAITTFKDLDLPQLACVGIMDSKCIVQGCYHGNEVFSWLAPHQKLIAMSSCIILPAFMLVSHFAHFRLNLLLCPWTISMGGMTLDKLPLPRSCSFFCSVRNPEVSGFSCRTIFIFQSSRLSEFLTDLRDSGL